MRRQAVRARGLAQAGLVVACLTAGAVAQILSWKPAKFLEGMLPLTPFQAAAGGEVFVEATVTNTGGVSGLTALRTTPPFTELVLETVRGWRFQPAERTMLRIPGDPRSSVTETVESKVLIASVFRPPTLNSPTVGDPPTDVQPASDDVAAPLNVVTPLYPPLALFDGTVLVEVTVDINGRVASATTVQSAPGFDEAALAAARQWTFRPARVDGRPLETFAYLVFAFRQPVTSPSRR